MKKLLLSALIGITSLTTGGVQASEMTVYKNCIFATVDATDAFEFPCSFTHNDDGGLTITNLDRNHSERFRYVGFDRFIQESTDQVWIINDRSFKSVGGSQHLIWY